MKPFIAPAWRQLLSEKGLLSFEALWERDLPLLDEANTNRGGISTVSRMRISHPGGTAELIVKRQQNHHSRTWRHPVAGIPTFEKEFNNIQAFLRRGIATLSPVYFAKRQDDSGTRAILVNEYLTDYQPLDEWAFTSENMPRGARYAKKRRLIRDVARFVRRIHDRGMIHNCLYPKHIFISEGPDCFDLRIIDLEKSRPFLIGRSGILKDLETIHRRAYQWSRTDYLRFLLAYQGVSRPTMLTRWILGRIRKRTRRKQER